jgi:4-amino-4-deoxy-L-arabinose transferase-like glycosyltransferase
MAISNRTGVVAEDFSRGFDDLKDDFERHSQDSGLGLFIRRALLYVLGIEFALSLLASLRYARKIAPAAMWVECSVLLASCLVCYLMATGRLDLKISRLAQLNFPPVLIGLGIALRLGWVMVMPPVQLSDAKDYLTLAQTLLKTGTYVDLETGHRLLAFRAPGYPAFLAAAMRVFGDNSWMPAATNVILFIGSALLLASAAKALGGRRGQFIALLLFALWPSDIFATGQAGTESISLFLLTGALWFFSLSDVHGAKASVAAGILGGAVALTRPTLLLLPLLWALFMLVGPNPLRRLKQLVIASIVMAATIAPWTFRNYRVLHAFVPISTNGGDVFYRANNNLASGGYTVAAEKDLNALQDQGEARWNRESFKEGENWIRTHPVQFLKLAVVKGMIFVRDDETGIYWSMARGHENTGPAYVALQVLSDTWWQVLCFLGLVALWRYDLIPNAQAALLASGFVLLVMVHMVFESQSRYRMPGMGPLILIIASALARPAGHREARARLDLEAE